MIKSDDFYICIDTRPDLYEHFFDQEESKNLINSIENETIKNQISHLLMMRCKYASDVLTSQKQITSVANNAIQIAFKEYVKTTNLLKEDIKKILTHDKHFKAKTGKQAKNIVSRIIEKEVQQKIDELEIKTEFSAFEFWNNHKDSLFWQIQLWNNTKNCFSEMFFAIEFLRIYLKQLKKDKGCKPYTEISDAICDFFQEDYMESALIVRDCIAHLGSKTADKENNIKKYKNNFVIFSTGGQSMQMFDNDERFIINRGTLSIQPKDCHIFYRKIIDLIQKIITIINTP